MKRCFIIVHNMKMEITMLIGEIQKNFSNLRVGDEFPLEVVMDHELGVTQNHLEQDLLAQTIEMIAPNVPAEEETMLEKWV